jgi:hypothetical protein
MQQDAMCRRCVPISRVCFEATCGVREWVTGAARTHCLARLAEEQQATGLCVCCMERCGCAVCSTAQCVQMLAGHRQMHGNSANSHGPCANVVRIACCREMERREKVEEARRETERILAAQEAEVQARKVRMCTYIRVLSEVCTASAALCTAARQRAGLPLSKWCSCSPGALASCSCKLVGYFTGVLVFSLSTHQTVAAAAAAC